MTSGTQSHARRVGSGRLGSGEEVFISHGSGQEIFISHGSGQEVITSHGSGRVVSGFLKSHGSVHVSGFSAVFQISPRKKVQLVYSMVSMVYGVDVGVWRIR